MVQGIIDLYYETDEGIVVVDYKSDKIQNENEFSYTPKYLLIIITEKAG